MWNNQQRTTARERVKAAFLPVKLLAVIKSADSWNRHRSSHNEIRRWCFMVWTPAERLWLHKNVLKLQWLRLRAAHRSFQAMSLRACSTFCVANVYVPVLSYGDACRAGSCCNPSPVWSLVKPQGSAVIPCFYIHSAVSSVTVVGLRHPRLCLHTPKSPTKTSLSITSPSHRNIKCSKWPMHGVLNVGK